jgi:hypothetical protein
MLLAVPTQAFGRIRHTFRPACQRNMWGIMNTGSSKSPDSGAWRDLYKVALFEVDKARLPERIAQAEKAPALGHGSCFTWLETTSKRKKLWMTRCTPCMPCRTHRKLATNRRQGIVPLRLHHFSQSLPRILSLVLTPLLASYHSWFDRALDKVLQWLTR